ncbi:hypothetical protein [Solibacillus sp. FSL W8-0372]|uniref:hypothetical protein n=1 Tax=Solibacillus sp. FSL W8-0372 TaxID=2921713 RepID=UPI0030CFC755
MSEVLELVESYNEYLSTLPKGIEYIYTSLRNKEVEQALEVIKNFSEGLIWLESATKILKNDNDEVNISLNEILPYLEEVNSAIEKNDFYLVADIFEYEILEYCKKIKFINLSQ